MEEKIDGVRHTHKNQNTNRYAAKYTVHPWKVMEEEFRPEMNEASESLFSLGNGKMGQRANSEEAYSGDTLPGNYIAGVYYPDKTRVGWWKNGYPEYYAKVPNAANWNGIQPVIDGVKLDLAKCEVHEFRRELDMKTGVLKREFEVSIAAGKKVRVSAERFISMADREGGAIRYTVSPMFSVETFEVEAFIDGDVRNRDANYDERFWDETYRRIEPDMAFLTMKTFRTEFEVCSAQKVEVKLDGRALPSRQFASDKVRYVANSYSFKVPAGGVVEIDKYVVNISSMDHPVENLAARAEEVLNHFSETGYEELRTRHEEAWAKRWEVNDIVIEGDDAAQQAIRFNLFHLQQTYIGDDPRLNIGPKGFTGEKYGGSTYWDTEAYCLPFYMLTAGSEVAKNLLRYRYNHLPKAIENAEKLGFTGGAALYPMVTMNGEECHNEWEITFEEIHRNGAIAYAIYNYIRHTGDEEYLKEGGLEVLLAISRFWAQRVHRSPDMGKFVMLGVTGPNEYDNNVDNNWYTNYIARWTLQYTLESIGKCKEDRAFWSKFIRYTDFDEPKERIVWDAIIADMYFPEMPDSRIFLQQDGFLNKEDLTVADLDPAVRPINQHWSWDRILRSIFIKQADVLQGLYFFEDHFDRETICENFDYYEPRTVHESSLSPCVHAILAAHLGREEKAYEMYLRTSRLDLDDYNHEVHEGLHITSMAGTWMAVVEGFAGKRIREGVLSFDPMLPKRWTSFSFRIIHRGTVIRVEVLGDSVRIASLSGPEQRLFVYGESHTLPAGGEIKIAR